jgi:hypothetical protein
MPGMVQTTIAMTATATQTKTSGHLLTISHHYVHVATSAAVRRFGSRAIFPTRSAQHAPPLRYRRGGRTPVFLVCALPRPRPAVGPHQSGAAVVQAEAGFTTEKIGMYQFVYAHMCGTDHSTMRENATVESQAAFDGWLQQRGAHWT